MANRHMANWLIWRIDCGESAYGENAYGEMTSYRDLALLPKNYPGLASS